MVKRRIGERSFTAGSRDDRERRFAGRRSRDGDLVKQLKDCCERWLGKDGPMTKSTLTGIGPLKNRAPARAGTDASGRLMSRINQIRLTHKNDNTKNDRSDNSSMSNEPTIREHSPWQTWPDVPQTEAASIAKEASREAANQERAYLAALNRPPIGTATPPPPEPKTPRLPEGCASAMGELVGESNPPRTADRSRCVTPNR